MVAVSASALRHEHQTYLDAGFDDFISKPFRLEHICQCLANLLGIAFETESTSEAEEATETLEISLPEALLTALKTKAELYEVTDLETRLKEVEALGPAGKRLAEHLHGLIRNYDMDAVLNLLSGLEQA